MNNKIYYKDGTVLDHFDDSKILHRDDRLPAIEFTDGYKWWYVDGKRHRVDGLPAIECEGGDKWWYIDDILHRVDGPAMDFASGNKSWYIDGKKLTEEEFEAHPKRCNYLFMLAFEETMK